MREDTFFWWISLRLFKIVLNPMGVSLVIAGYFGYETIDSVIESLRKHTRRGRLRLGFSLWECLQLHWFWL